MPAFECKFVTNQGQVVTQVIESANEQTVSRDIIKKGGRPVSIKRKKGEKTGTGDLMAKKVKVDEIVLFTKQLVTLLRAGVPMLTALEALSSQSSSQLGQVINKVYVDVMSGKSFSQALDLHPKVFNKLFVNSVRAGEMSGSLDEVLERMAVVLKNDEETRKKVKGAMKYPIFVMSAMAGAFVLIMTMVVPKFALIFEGFGMELPIFTKILLGTSKFVQKYIFVIVGIVGVLVVGIKIFRKNPQGRLLWDTYLMKIPMIGALVTKSAMARFTKMFETLNRSGLPILQTLNTVAGAVGNLAIESKIKEVALGVERGEGISGAMKKTGLFPPMVIRMISIGEQSGSLDNMLASVSNHFDMEVEYAIKGLTSMIEPILTLALGGAVTVMAFGIFLPMWSLTGAVR